MHGSGQNAFAVLTNILCYYSLQVQRYEGASTIYGPHTLTLYLNQYRKLASALSRASIIIIIIIIIIMGHAVA
jgi:hypothetical protein